MRSLRAPIVSTGVFAVALAAGLAAVALSSRADLAERRQAAASVAAGAAFALESQLSRSLSATYALAAVIRRYGEVADFDEMAAEMLHHYGGISSLQLAPGAVVRRIHPLVGNEKALGHDLLADPARRDEARAAIESRQLVLAGPLALHQGGAGLVGRCPVFRPGPDGAERFWGFAQVVIRLPELLEASHLGRLSGEGYAYEVSRADRTTGVRASFASAGGPLADPVTFAVKVPGSEWLLAVAPAGGWGQPRRLALGLFLATAAAAGFAALACRVARQRVLLERRVAARTAELSEAYRSLAADAEQRHRTEEQLRQAQKMEAVGLLAGGVAHDFNNLLTGILGNAQALAEEMETGSPAQETARTIEMAAGRAAELTRQLLGFARRGKLRAAPVDLHGLVGEALRLLARTLDKGIVLVERLEAERAVVQGDAGQLQQAVLNLAVNARDAMPAGGTLTFSTALVELSPQAARERPGVVPGVYVALTVADTGHGMAAEIQHRVFEPFFTTKEPGKGTGMGLAMVYGIVSNHGGFVTLESAPGRGSRFTLHVPAAELEADRAASPAPRTGRGRILVVDDEEVVRAAAEKMLRRLGYEVVAVNGGRAALDVVRRDATAVDLVLLDLAMPVMDGRDTFRALRALRPGLRAVLSTGYGRDGRAQELLDEGMVGFVGKPYTMEELGDAVGHALAES